MRPITLDIAGLNSFRERRVIQFEPLLRDNLFGIFGPTGSGKSTILDAITLALFGEVKRAERKTHGIVNARSEDCSVAFTFQITRNGERECYRAERLFKKSDSGGAVTKRARLIRITDEEIPLADKEKEVTSKVEEILGIKADDFRLSVVLPQGAFAEFLHLRPKDRGEMLQRIFGLEEMGNRINTRLRDLRSKLEGERIGIEVKIESLAAYNDNALAQRRREFDQANENAEASKKKEEERAIILKEGEELYKLILERTQLMEGEAARNEEGKKLTLLQTDLGRGERAVVLEAIVREAQSTRKRWEQAVAEYERATVTQQSAEQVIASLREGKEWAEREQTENGRLEELEKQVKVLEGIAEVDHRILLLVRSIEDRQRKIAAAEAQLNERRIIQENALNVELQTKNALESLEANLKALNEKKEALSNQKISVDKLERLAGEWDQKSLLLKKIKEEEADLNAQIDILKERIGKGLKVVQERQINRDAARNQYEEARLGNALGEALPMLHDGEPCPLCGATDHPTPYSHSPSYDLKALAANIEKAERSLNTATDQLHTLEKEEASLQTKFAGTETRRKEIESEVEQRIAEIQETVQETGYKGETDTETLRGWQTNIAERLARNTEEQQQAQKEKQLLGEKATEAQATVSESGKERAKLEQEIESTATELEREEQEIASIRGARREKLAETGLTIGEGDGENELATQREEFGNLKKKIAEIEKNFDEAEARLKEASKEYDRTLAACKREEEEKNRTEGELEKGLRENDFNSIEEWREAFITPEERSRKRSEAEEIADRLKNAERRSNDLSTAIGERQITVEELSELRKADQEATREKETALTTLGKAEQAVTECELKNADWKKIVAESEKSGKEYAAVKKLSSYVQGNAFINFLADEYLQHICRTASLQLRDLTGGRLEIGSKGEEGFFILDNGNGGVERPPASLSGGETFLVSLALSLSLSDSLQVGRAPLEFFFLDEGFGTLDEELLEIVMDSLERLRTTSHRAIGVISHVPHLRERIPRRLILTPATDTAGSDVRLDVS